MKYQDLILLHKPSLFLPLDEASGDFLDLSGNGRHASLFGNLTRASTFRTVNGKGGVAAGSVADGYIIGQHGLGDVPPGDFTIEFWYAATDGAYQCNREPLVNIPWHFERFDTYLANSGCAHLHWTSFYNNLYIIAHQANSTPTTYSGSNTQRDDANYLTTGANETNESNTVPGISTALRHVCYCVYPLPVKVSPENQRHKGNRRLYVNGVHSTSGESDNYTGFPLANPFFGPGILCDPTSASTQSKRAKNVWISNVAIYPRALTPAQILLHYQTGAGSGASNRVAGTTLLDGVATGGFPVFVHRRDTGECIGRTVSDASGAFSCSVGTYAAQVYAVALDPVSGYSYPAQVFDLIVPSI